MLVSLVQVTKVEAANGELAGEVKSDFAKAISDLQTTELMGGVTLYKQQIETLYNGITDKTNPKYKWNPHTVQWVDLPATSENVNVVVWTDGGKHGWASSTVRNTAKDFEEKNPEKRIKMIMETNNPRENPLSRDKIKLDSGTVPSDGIRSS